MEFVNGTREFLLDLMKAPQLDDLHDLDPMSKAYKSNNLHGFGRLRGSFLNLDSNALIAEVFESLVADLRNLGHTLNQALAVGAAGTRDQNVSISFDFAFSHILRYARNLQKLATKPHMPYTQLGTWKAVGSSLKVL